MSDGRNLITHSRAQAAKTCLRKHHYQYDLGIRKDRASTPLRMGSVIHKGKELLRKGVAHGAAIATALEPYTSVPDGVDAFSWAIEREKCYRLLHAYLHVYADDGLFIVAIEQAFELPIINPETQKPSTKFKMAGKIDGIVQLPDGRIAVDETKTTGQSIEDGSDYWTKLQIDEQITRYVYAARMLGHDVSCVHYDVIRKPGIEPKQIAVLDEQGFKIVLDTAGERVLNKNGTPKQSGSTEQGWTLQTRLETAQEYGDRLTADIGERPQFYFARREITRTEADIREFLNEQWQQQKTIAEAQNTGRHFRNTGACLSPCKCEFFEVCCSGLKPEEQTPPGFRVLEHVHPELESEGE